MDVEKQNNSHMMHLHRKAAESDTLRQYAHHIL